MAYASADLARRLGLSELEVQTVWWGATLHDLGKLGVPIDVLRKVGPLDEAEWSQIHRHPAIGYDLLLAISPSLAPIAAAVRAHHERWDGGGYPDRLAGEDIPLSGRIVAVADAFDCMIQRRPYRAEVLAAEDAISELQRQSGSQFDPCLVLLFVELHNAMGEGLCPVSLRGSTPARHGDWPASVGSPAASGKTSTPGMSFG